MEDKTPHKSIKKDNKPSLAAMREKDREKVRGIFRFHEVPGGLMEFSVKIYKDDLVETYRMVDGQIYTIPLGVAKHLNKNCWYPEYDYVKTEGENGMHNVAKVTKKVRRCSFQSLEFVDIDELLPGGDAILTVETSIL